MSAENLPIELISYILQFLNLSDRQEAALTCKRWYQASLDPGLHKNTIITIRAPTAQNSQLRQLGQHKSANLVLSHIDSSSNCRTVLRDTGRHLGPHLESLSLKGSDVTPGVFMDILTNCPNLQKLDLSRCNCLFMSGTLLSKPEDQKTISASFQNLKTLNLSGIRYLSDELLNRLVAVAPNLQKLSLASCNIAFEVELCPNNGKSSMNFITLTNLLKVLKERANQIKSLDLSHTGVSNRALKYIADVPGLQLEEIYIRKCSSFGNEGLIEFAEKQSGLKVLDANGCRDLGDSALLAVCENLIMLKSLDIHDWVQVSTNAAEHISSLSQLVSLNMSNCLKAMLGPGAKLVRGQPVKRTTSAERNLAPVKLPTGLGSGKLVHLRSLNLSCCVQLDDEAVIGLTKALPKLQALDLASCVAVSDASLHAISANLPSLQMLRLAWCKKITDFGLLGVDKSCPSISLPDEASQYYSDRFTKSHSNMGFFKGPSFDEKITKIPEDALENLKAKSTISLASLTKLRHLDLTACHHVTDIGIRAMVKFQDLQSINLSLCPNISDVSVLSIAVNNPSLEEVHLAQCNRITDHSIITLAQTLQRLHNLDICGCDQVSNKSLDALSRHAPRLKHLNVSQCSGVTMEGIDGLQTSLYGLQTLQLGHSAVGAPTAFYMPNYF